jgi:ubiquinone/menaquinone biosynthesis C-methylase UbiE
MHGIAEQEYYERFAASLSDDELRQRLQAGSDEMLRFDPLLGAIPPEIGSLLDVGCGPGVLLATLRRERPELRAVGLERSRGLAEAGRRLFGVEIVPGSIDRLPFEDRAFDALVACELLEHLPYGVYEPALAEMQRVARRMVFVSVPYRERRDGVVCPYCNCRFDVNFHMRHFDKPTLRGLLTDFELVRMMPICVSRTVLSGLAHSLQRACYTWGRQAAFPRHALCPQCGYHLAEGGAAPAAGVQAGKHRSSWRQAIRARLPKTLQIRWMIAIYRRSPA